MGVPRVLAAPMRRGVYAVGMVIERMLWERKGTYGKPSVYGKKAI